MAITEEELKLLRGEIKQKLEKELVSPKEQIGTRPITSLEYQEFKAAYMPRHMSLYEKAANFSEKIIKLKPDKKREAELLEDINICHLSITPAGAVSFAYFYPTIFILAGVFLSFAIPTVLGADISMFFILFFLIAGLVLIFPFSKIPDYLADSWRLKSSNQMVLCIFYIVTYMRHTSNLERGVAFASDHLGPPLSLDLKKVLWDVETEKYENIKESLEAYLETWKKYNSEFIESFHLLESSLYEGSETRRLELLDKALSVMLEETYEKMLHYAQNLKSPLTMLHMLGVVLPILLLVILPLVVSFMQGVEWYHIAMIFNVIIPIVVFYLSKNILSKRPTGYGETDITEENPELKKYKKILFKFGKSEIKLSPLIVCIILGGVLVFIGFLPLILHATAPDPKWDIVIMQGSILPTTVDQYTPANQLQKVSFSFLGYRDSKTSPGALIGPYGLGASIFSLAITLGLGLGVGLYFKIRSKNVREIRENVKALEQEFSSALFQLGSRLADGLPAEICFGKVADTMEGTTSGNFFRAVEINIRRLGMGLEQAIFDPRAGAILRFPSHMIDSSMKVLIESSKKGPRIAAQAVLNVSRYIKELHKVDERLKDLMADVISDMKSQINFLTPAISGIVIGITSMITSIIGKLGQELARVQAGAAGAGGAGAGAGLMEIFGDGIPTYYFQIIVGIYVVQIVYILTTMSNGIENGEDKLEEEYMVGQYVTRSTILYVFISLVVMILFNTIAATILQSTIA